VSKRNEILKAASAVIASQGLSNLTLDAVAKEAGVSKGGLLYHFPSKDALIEGMSRFAIDEFNQEVEKEQEQTKSFIQAYAQATLNDLEHPQSLNLDTSLLAAIGNNHDLLHPWQEQYEKWDKQIRNGGENVDLSLIIRFVCDGLWFSKMFGLQPVEKERQDRMMKYLFTLLEKESNV